MAQLSKGSLDRIMDWLGSADAMDGDNQIFIELVERIAADTWRSSGRWYMAFDPVSEVWDCQPRDGLHVLMTEEPISAHEWMVRVRGIYFDPEDHPEWDGERDPF